jgi:hypothetical protein
MTSAARASSVAGNLSPIAMVFKRAHQRLPAADEVIVEGL